MKKRLYYIDNIKVFGLILVFICHFTRSLEANGVGYAIKVLPDKLFNLYIGSFGVSLFFIASGASLMYVYEEKLDVKVYLKKRFRGIYPMFWLAFFTATVISFFRNYGIDETIPKWKIIFSIIGFDGNTLWWGNNFYRVGEWFLSVIICLYILFPLIRKCVLKHPVITTVISIVLLAVSMLCFKTKMPIECFVIARVPEFLFGMLYIKYIKQVDIKMLIIGIIGLGVAFFINLGENNVMLQTLLVGLSSFICLTWIFVKTSKFIFIRKISTVGGKYCYPFFLTHHYLTEWLTEPFTGIVLRLSEVYFLCLICFVLTIIASKYLFDINKKALNILSIENKENK